MRKLSRAIMFTLLGLVLMVSFQNFTTAEAENEFEFVDANPIVVKGSRIVTTYGGGGFGTVKLSYSSSYVPALGGGSTQSTDAGVMESDLCAQITIPDLAQACEDARANGRFFIFAQDLDPDAIVKDVMEVAVSLDEADLQRLTNLTSDFAEATKLLNDAAMNGDIQDLHLQFYERSGESLYQFVGTEIERLDLNDGITTSHEAEE